MAEATDEAPPEIMCRNERRVYLRKLSKLRASDMRKLDDDAGMSLFHFMKRLQREGGPSAARKLRAAGDALCAELIERGLVDNVGVPAAAAWASDQEGASDSGAGAI